MRYKKNFPSLKPGDCIIHHCEVAHGSDKNISNLDRVGLVINYKARGAKVDKDSWSRYQKDLKKNLKFLKKESYSERTLGIAINPMDNIKDIRNLVAEIVNMKSFQKIIIRFHPRMKINKFTLETVGDISWAEHITIFTIPDIA